VIVRRKRSVVLPVRAAVEEVEHGPNGDEELFGLFLGELSLSMGAVSDW
jgi:hypothetical protein